MSAGNSAIAQMALLRATEKKAALTKLFSGGDIDQPAITRPSKDGRFVSRVCDKRVLLAAGCSQEAEILSIVDRFLCTNLNERFQ